ncbi:MAG: hypothetical protein ABIK28_18050 [Planctomycetota bacterium]
MSTVSSQMIFRQTKNVPGVVAMAILREGQILDVDVPELIGRDTINSSAVVINDLVQGLAMTSGTSFERLNLFTKDFNVILLPASEYTVLLLTEKRLNNAMLNLTLKMVKEKLAGGGVTFPAGGAMSTGSVKAPVAEAIQPQSSQAVHSGPGPEFNQKKAQYLEYLTEFLGPMAPVVFEDALEEAATAPGDDRSKLERLKQLLVAEIPDSDNRGQFSNLCNQL